MGVGSIRAAQAGTIKQLKKKLKESSGGDDKWFYRLKADSDITVRFMAEPPDFISYDAHWDADKKVSFPCNDGDCIGCDEGLDARKTWVAPVLDVDESRVRAMILPKGVVDSLVKKFETRSTLLDRDYLIMREGSTMEDTKYEVDPEAPKRRDMSIYTTPDIMAMLEQQLEDALEEYDQGPRRTSKRASKNVAKKVSKAVAKKVARRRAVQDDDDDDDPGFSSKPSKAVKRSTGAARKPLKKAVPAVKKKGLRR